MTVPDAGMKLPDSAHTSRPWRIHELTPDFRLEDVWAMPTAGGLDDFSRLAHVAARWDPAKSGSRAVRTLFAMRFKVGGWFGWDDDDPGVFTLRDRLPEDLRDAPRGPELDAAPSSSLYLLDDEWALDLSNKTMQGVFHMGWVPDETGGYRGQMAILVKRLGPLSTAYMAATAPFRQPVVYPPLMRDLDRMWRAAQLDTAEGREPRESMWIPGSEVS